MYKHILAQHNIWRLREMLKSCLKPWEVLCMGLKELKCLLLTLFCALTLNFRLWRETHKVPDWQFLYRFPWRETSHMIFLCCSVVPDTCSVRGALFHFPAQWCWNWKANALAGPCVVIHHHIGTNCSPPGMQWSKYCIMFIDPCDPPETPGHLWSLWAQQDTGLPCKVL